MDKMQLQQYCLTLPGTTTDFQEDWQAQRFHVGGKMFAMFGTDAKGIELFTMKCDPDRAAALREEHEEIIAGYYMNKTHWNSIYYTSEMPTEFGEQLLKNAYELIFNKLTKKAQNLIYEQSIV
ncbi:MmcQ/YjbR family DNA-binding protein [Kurthia sibirica]|uniref:DNA-binding protein n=1 Tax=Kurthia sibirica TaxID=202750 RepID=A0A2U3AJ11_9BACL|nr:MmcQ/YjbR family DNA-binding protein [Kurthia sibirica]PWI24542.1 DNA-binding protein [Kurthia sibirica]GEK33611.1 hypothetical protein KSI01_11440 [Kurthia sibirica]